MKVRNSEAELQVVELGLEMTTLQYKEKSCEEPVSYTLQYFPSCYARGNQYFVSLLLLIGSAFCDMKLGVPVTSTCPTKYKINTSVSPHARYQQQDIK